MVRVTFSFLEKERNQKLNTPTQRLFFCQFIFRTSVFLISPRRKTDEEQTLSGVIIAVLLSFTVSSMLILPHSTSHNTEPFIRDPSPRRSRREHIGTNSTVSFSSPLFESHSALRSERSNESSHPKPFDDLANILSLRPPRRTTTIRRLRRRRKETRRNARTPTCLTQTSTVSSTLTTSSIP